MNRICYLLLALLCNPIQLWAQQFIGLSANRQFAQISLTPSNPSFVVKEEGGMELNLFSGSFLFGTNAYNFDKEWFTGGMNAGASEGEEYTKDLRKKKKHLWGNIDIMGPSVSFTLKDEHHIGVYTRVRQVTRAGNLNNEAFQFIGDVSDLVKYPDTVQFSEAGFTTHIFGEVGFTYGKVLSDDLYKIVKVGVTVKYLMGIAAGSLYTPSTDLIKNTGDSTRVWKGDLTTLYSENFKTYVDNDPGNDLESWGNRGGNGSLGFDIGMQYEYHPDGDPNRKTPYSFKLAASITDIGSISYRADTGSGIYKVNIANRPDWRYQRQEFEDFPAYFGRLKKDSVVVQTDSSETFRVGLPTAFRVNTDWNISSNFWLGVNLVLNMRGNNGNIYRPGYVNLLNFTPRYEKGWFMIGLPLSFVGYQTVTFGAILRAGPLVVGSSSIISTLLRKEINNTDAYVGLSFRIPGTKSTYAY